jgi:asparagine synthase (glutamine-hydrolysing)
MGMACSLEIRAPFLDADFAGLALAQPPEARLPRGNLRKWPLIEAFRDWVPEANWQRPKQGFGLPFEYWLRNELRPRVEEEMVSSAHAPEFFDVQAVRVLWERFQKSPASIGWSRLWALFVLCHYVRQQKLT